MHGTKNIIYYVRQCSELLNTAHLTVSNFIIYSFNIYLATISQCDIIHVNMEMEKNIYVQ